MPSSRTALHRQQGLSILSLFAVMAILGFLVLVGLRAVPAWTEYMAIKKMAFQIESSGVREPLEARRRWDERAPLEYIETIKGADLRITRVARGLKLDFDYDRRIHLVGNAYLVFTFASDLN